MQSSYRHALQGRAALHREHGALPHWANPSPARRLTPNNPPAHTQAAERAALEERRAELDRREKASASACARATRRRPSPPWPSSSAAIRPLLSSPSPTLPNLQNLHRRPSTTAWLGWPGMRRA